MRRREDDETGRDGLARTSGSDPAPRLHQQLTGLPWPQISAVDVTHDKGHSHTEKRTLKLATVADTVAGGLGFPHAQLAIQIVRRRRLRDVVFAEDHSQAVTAQHPG